MALNVSAALASRFNELASGPVTETGKVNVAPPPSTGARKSDAMAVGCASNVLSTTKLFNARETVGSNEMLAGPKLSSAMPNCAVPLKPPVNASWPLRSNLVSST